MNDNKQMTDVWHLPAIAPWEKTCTKHPTQKPLGLLTRIILATTRPNDWVLDPFAGSSTTGIAANLFGRRYLGIEQEHHFLEISKARRMEIEQPDVITTYRDKILKQLRKQNNGYKTEPLTETMLMCEDVPSYNISILPF